MDRVGVFCEARAPFCVLELRGGEDNDSDQNAGASSDLRVAQRTVEVDARVDADEFDKEAPNAGEHEVEAGDPSDRAVFAAELPDKPKDGQRKEKFVDRRGLDQ